MSVFTINLDSRIRTVIIYARSTFLSEKKRNILVKYLNSLTPRRLSSIIIHFDNEETSKSNLLNYVRESTDYFTSLEPLELLVENEEEYVEENVDEEDAINEILFTNQQECDEDYEEPQLNQFDRSVIVEVTESYIDSVEQAEIELVILDD